MAVTLSSLLVFLNSDIMRFLVAVALGGTFGFFVMPNSNESGWASVIMLVLGAAITTGGVFCCWLLGFAPESLWIIQQLGQLHFWAWILITFWFAMDVVFVLRTLCLDWD